MTTKVKVLTLAIAAACALALAGCGASRLERMTTAAGALHGVASGAGAMIDQTARVRGRAAQAAGEDVDAAIETLRPAQSAQHLFAASVDAFVGAVLTNARAADALRLLGHALDVYEQMRVLLLEYGIEAPHLPDLIHDILGARR